MCAQVHMHFNFCLLDCVKEYMLCSLSIYSPTAPVMDLPVTFSNPAPKECQHESIYSTSIYVSTTATRAGCGSWRVGCIRKQTDKKSSTFKVYSPAG